MVSYSFKCCSCNQFNLSCMLTAFLDLFLSFSPCSLSLSLLNATRVRIALLLLALPPPSRLTWLANLDILETTPDRIANRNVRSSLKPVLPEHRPSSPLRHMLPHRLPPLTACST